MASLYTLETIHDENTGSVTVLGALNLGDLEGCNTAVMAYLEEFGFNHATGVFDVGGIPVTVNTAEGEGTEIEAVASSGALSPAEADLRAAVRYVLEIAVDMYRYYKAMKAAEAAV